MKPLVAAVAVLVALTVGVQAQTPENDALRVRAEAGDAEAQFSLGSMYANGEGVPQDDAEAVRWFRLAADQGHARAQYNLGVMYANGRGVPEDDAEAVRWWRLAAEQGYARAQYNLGVMYANGRGVPQDDAEAVRWYRLAAEQGEADAQYNLALMYGTGEGVPEDDAEAVRWYRLAAEQGDAEAQYNLGNMYANGEGVPQDDAEAVRWYRLGARGESPAAFDRRCNPPGGVAPRSQMPQFAPSSRLTIRAHHRSLCNAGFHHGLLAAEQGHAGAMTNLGAMYSQGRGVVQDYVQSHMWRNLAASRQTGEDRELSVKARDAVASFMTADDLSEAQRLAREWDEAHPREP